MGTTRQPRQQQPERTIGEERRRPEHLGQKDAPHPHHQRLTKLQPPTLTERPGWTVRHHVDIWDEWTTEPPVCRMDDGIPHRVDRIRGLGNAIVPQLAWRIFDTINQYEALHYENK